MHRKWSLPAVALFTAMPAYAHGEEVLATVFAQFIAVAGTIVALRLLPKARPHWVAGLAGCISGVVISWVLTGALPYTEHRTLITVIEVGVPLGLSALCVYVARRVSGSA